MTSSDQLVKYHAAYCVPVDEQYGVQLIMVREHNVMKMMKMLIMMYFMS